MASLGLTCPLCEVGPTTVVFPRVGQRKEGQIFFLTTTLGSVLGENPRDPAAKGPGLRERQGWGGSREQQEARAASSDPNPPPAPQPTSHMRLLFLQMSTCSGAMTRPVKGPISVPALIHVLEKMPRPSPGMELCAMITSAGSTRLDSFCTSVAAGELGQSPRRIRSAQLTHPKPGSHALCVQGSGGCGGSAARVFSVCNRGTLYAFESDPLGLISGRFLFFSVSPQILKAPTIPTAFLPRKV